MAIFKASSYTKKAADAKASIRYIQHRPGKDGEKITRTLFNADGVMGRSEAYRMIDEAASQSYFYRLVISPDALTEDTHQDLYLQEVTEQVMLEIEDRFRKSVQWVASLHDDHTPYRHVHIVTILPKRLQVQDLQDLRQIATKFALMQRRAKDAAREQRQWQEGVQWGR